MTIPEKPSRVLVNLYRLGFIHGLHLEQKQTGDAIAAETFCIIVGSEGTVKGRWRTYEPYLLVQPFYNGIAELRKECVRQVRDWEAYEEGHREELAEYARLKAKYG